MICIIQDDKTLMMVIISENSDYYKIIHQYLEYKYPKLKKMT